MTSLGVWFRHYEKEQPGRFGEDEMTHEDRGHYARKHPPGLKPDPQVLREVKKRASREGISCAEAFTIVRDLNTSPTQVGFAIDSLEIPIVKCSLGLFGYSPRKKIIEPLEEIPRDIREAIENALQEKRLTCKDAWDISDRLGVKKMTISSACEGMNIKIIQCQLGAF